MGIVELLKVLVSFNHPPLSNDSVDMNGGQQGRGGSRWDALRDDGRDKTPSSSSSNQRRLPRRGRSNSSSNATDGRYHQRSGGGVSAVQRGSTGGGNWRRPPPSSSDAATASTTSSSTAQPSAPGDVRVRAATQSLKNAISSFIEIVQRDECSETSVGNRLQPAIEQLSRSLQPKTQAQNATAYVVSNDVLWEASYSTFQGMQSISQLQRKIDCVGVLTIMATIAATCCQMISHNLQAQSDSRHRPKSMTDLRLCEFAAALLELLKYAGDSTNTDQLSYKAALFACLSKVLTVSTTCNGGSGKCNKERRGPLFPWGAEKTVNLIVKQAVLPFVEGILGIDDVNLATPLKVQYCHGAMECLYLLLKDPYAGTVAYSTINTRQLSKHAAAILAPLVIDVNSEGKENQTTNPLRARSLSAICSYWNCSYQLTQIESTGCFDGDSLATKCLTATLNSLCILRKGKVQGSQQSEASNSLEIDVSSITKQIQSLLQNEQSQVCQSRVLNLLSSLCLGYPSATVRHWHLFLEKPTSNYSQQYTNSKERNLPLLLALSEQNTSSLSGRHDSTNTLDILPDILHTITALVSAMPFTHWISYEGKSSMRLSGGNFSSRIRNSMLGVMSTLFGLLTTIKDKVSNGLIWSEDEESRQLMQSTMEQASLLAEKLCSALPFSGENSVLLQPASTLVRCAGEIYVCFAKAVEEMPLTKMGSDSIIYKALSYFGRVITCLSRNSSTVEFSPPAQLWLSDSSSYEFIGLLLSGSSTLSTDRMEMLSSIARTCPWALAREPFNLASFCEVCSRYCGVQNNAATRLIGLKLIESFIIGRRNSSKESESQSTDLVVQTFCPLLLLALNDESASVRSSAASSFGSLLRVDWKTLLSTNSDAMDDIDWKYTNTVLWRCTSNHGERNANVRSASCKAIGDLCTTCLTREDDESGNSVEEVPFTDDFTITLCHAICKEMEHAIRDDNATVRSMALFALGNAALALKGHPSERFRSHPMPISFSSVYSCLDDKDEKVVGNAIRTIAHLAHFFYSSDFATEEDLATTSTLDSYCTLLTSLSAKVKLALDDATGESSAELTWKQRNGAKKHAWGSCTTLGTLFSFSTLTCRLDTSVLETALLELFRCLQLSNTINDKITTASVHTLAKMPASFWQCLPVCDSIGHGIATCFSFLHEVSLLALCALWLLTSASDIVSHSHRLPYRESSKRHSIPTSRVWQECSFHLPRK